MQEKNNLIFKKGLFSTNFNFEGFDSNKFSSNIVFDLIDLHLFTSFVQLT